MDQDKRYIFNYPDFGTPDVHPDYTAHRGANVRIIRQLRPEERAEECGVGYEIQAEDGWTGTADASELEPVQN